MEHLQFDNDIIASIGKIEPERSLDRSILRLLEKETIKRITKYQIMIHSLEKKYGMTFEKFEMRIKESKPEYTVEQDYYDWDLAITAKEDMEIDLEKVRIRLEKNN